MEYKRLGDYEIVKSAKIEHDENRHNLAIGHTRRTSSSGLSI